MFSLLITQGTKEEQIHFLWYFLEFLPKWRHGYSLEYFLELYLIRNFVEHTLRHFFKYLLHRRAKDTEQYSFVYEFGDIQ